MLLLQSVSSLFKKSTRCVYLRGSSKVLEGSSPLICQNTNHSFIILNRLRYVLRLPDKSYSVSTQLLCVSCRPLSVLDGTQLRLGELLPAPKGLGKTGEGVQDMWGKMWTGWGGRGAGASVGLLHFPFLSGQFSTLSLFLSLSPFVYLPGWG